MRIYVTKYALTNGIELYENADVNTESNMACVDSTNSSSPWSRQYFHGHGREFHFAQKDAIDAAKAMKERKIKSLQKQIEKLQKMEF